jgi:hypothetical protein
MNLMYGAAVATRAAWLRVQGVPIPPGADTIRPMELEAIRARLADDTAPARSARAHGIA